MEKKILVISYDEHLLVTRQLLFEREGFRVTSALGYLAARTACHLGGFDLAFIGHSVIRQDRDSLIREFREHNQAWVIVTTMNFGEKATEGVRLVHFWDGPKAILDAAKDLLRAASDRSRAD